MNHKQLATILFVMVVAFFWKEKKRWADWVEHLSPMRQLAFGICAALFVTLVVSACVAPVFLKFIEYLRF